MRVFNPPSYVCPRIHVELQFLEKRTSAAKQAAEKPNSLKGTAFRPSPRVSTYFGVTNWPAEDIFAVFRSTNRLSCASPGLLVRGSGFSTRMNAPVYRFRALALVAGGPVLSPAPPPTPLPPPVFPPTHPRPDTPNPPTAC